MLVCFLKCPIYQYFFLKQIQSYNTNFNFKMTEIMDGFLDSSFFCLLTSKKKMYSFKPIQHCLSYIMFLEFAI